MGRAAPPVVGEWPISTVPLPFEISTPLHKAAAAALSSAPRLLPRVPIMRGTDPSTPTPLSTPYTRSTKKPSGRGDAAFFPLKSSSDAARRNTPSPEATSRPAASRMKEV